jgi:hypothetical protein
MNERIFELAEQALEETHRVMGSACLLQCLLQEAFDDFYTEKFAELIIKECMACSTWVGKINTNSVEPVHTAHAINQRIKQQFGVEE